MSVSSADSVLAELTDALAPKIQVLGPLGSGGMGAVYLGRDPALKRSVAIKVLPAHMRSDHEARASFLREAQAAAGIVHPNVIAIYEVGELRSGTPYFVMQYVEGRSRGREVVLHGP